MVTSFPVVFDERRSARAITIDSIEDIPTALLEFGFRSRRPVVVVIGGASLMGDQGERLQDLFNRFLAPFIEESGGYAIDGGTAAGVMRLMGMAREKIGGTFPLIGVCPSALARWPDRSNSHPNAADLEPNHSHFILVPGSSWGDESPVLAEISKLLRQKNASVALLVNGMRGKILGWEIPCSSSWGREDWLMRLLSISGIPDNQFDRKLSISFKRVK
jgi:hypothetical protein